MAIVVESTANATETSSTNLVIGKPTGLTAGEVLIASLTCFDTSTPSITVPAGWTEIDSVQSSSNYVSIMYKEADASDVLATDFTFVCSEASFNVGALLRCSGVAVGELAGSATHADNSTGGSTLTGTASITPTQDGSLFVNAFAFETSDADAVVPTFTGFAVTGDTLTFTEVYDSGESGTGERHHGGAYSIQSSATAITAFSATSSVDSLDNCCGMIAVFIPRIDASGENNLIEATAVSTAQTGTAGTAGTNDLVEATAEATEQTGRGIQPTPWVTTPKS